MSCQKRFGSQRIIFTKNRLLIIKTVSITEGQTSFGRASSFRALASHDLGTFPELIPLTCIVRADSRSNLCRCQLVCLSGWTCGCRLSWCSFHRYRFLFQLHPLEFPHPCGVVLLQQEKGGFSVICCCPYYSVEFRGIFLQDRLPSSLAPRNILCVWGCSHHQNSHKGGFESQSVSASAIDTNASLSQLLPVTKQLRKSYHRVLVASQPSLCHVTYEVNSCASGLGKLFLKVYFWAYLTQVYCAIEIW